CTTTPQGSKLLGRIRLVADHIILGKSAGWTKPRCSTPGLPSTELLKGPLPTIRSDQGRKLPVLYLSYSSMRMTRPFIPVSRPTRALERRPITADMPRADQDRIGIEFCQHGLKLRDVWRKVPSVLRVDPSRVGWVEWSDWLG